MSPEKPHTLMSTVEKNIHMQQILEDILADRRMLQRQRGDMSSVGISYQIPEDMSAEAASVLQLLHMMNGQRGQALRIVAQRGKNELARFLCALYDWSNRMISGEGTMAELEVYKIPDSVRPLLMMSELNESALISRITIADHFQDVTEMTFEKKRREAIETIVGTQGVMDKKTIQSLLSTIGEIPVDLVTVQNIKQIESVLRSLEKESSVGVLAKHERSRILLSLFDSGIATKLRDKNQKQRNVRLDSRGLFIQFNDVNSHVPPAMISDASLEVLEHEGWITKQEVCEVRVSRAAANVLVHEHERCVCEQTNLFVSDFFEKTGRRFDDEYISGVVFRDPEAFATLIHQHGLLLPDEVINQMLQINPHTGYVALLTIAQTISSLLTSETFFHDYHTLQPLHRNKLQDEYRVQRALLRSPEYYVASKITTILLAQQMESAPEDKFLLFKGRYGKEGHHFLEAIDGTRLARVLFEDDTNSLASHVPLLEQSIYERLEAKLRAFNAARLTFQRISTAVGEATRSDVLDQAVLNRIPRADIEAVLTFLHTSLPFHFFERADRLYRVIVEGKVDDSETRQVWVDLLMIMHDALAHYEPEVYNQLDEDPVVDRVMIQPLTITFGTAFLELVKQVKPAAFFDEDICLHAVPIRAAALIEQGATHRSIPYFLEQAALDAIRLDRDRPLINFIGGAKYKETDPTASQLVAHIVMEVAHMHRANVCVPGTQSGVGIAFGKENMLYRQQFQHLPLRDQAHVFSVISGRDVLFPGNPYADNPGDELYGVNCVDIIFTKHSAEWLRVGDEKRESPYREQIRHMESVYKRTCAGKSVDPAQPRIAIVEEGGLYSIWELQEIIDDDFDILLIQGSGRFADVAAHILQNGSSFSDWSNVEAASAFVLEMLDSAVDHPYMSREMIERFKETQFGLTAGLETAQGTQKEDYQIYREAFCLFMSRAQSRRDRIHVTTIETLGVDLEKLL